MEGRINYPPPPPWLCSSLLYFNNNRIKNKICLHCLRSLMVLLFRFSVFLFPPLDVFLLPLFPTGKVFRILGFFQRMPVIHYLVQEVIRRVTRALERNAADFVFLKMNIRVYPKGLTIFFLKMQFCWRWLISRKCGR